MAKIKLEREKCIGCGSCSSVCPKFFEASEDGKSHLKGVERTQVEEVETPEVECAQSAADACPAQCIHIEK